MIHKLDKQFQDQKKRKTKRKKANAVKNLKKCGMR